MEKMSKVVGDYDEVESLLKNEKTCYYANKKWRTARKFASRKPHLVPEPCVFESGIFCKKTSDDIDRDSTSALSRDEWEIELYDDPDIRVGERYPFITNYVLTGHLGKDGRDILIDQSRVHLYLPHAFRTEKFAALIVAQDQATALVFANGKIVITGKTVPESALLALHFYQMELDKVIQPVIVRETDPSTGDKRKTRKLCFLKTLMGLSKVRIVNIVGSESLVSSPDEMVDLAALNKAYPDTIWEPQKFPGLKFELFEGNTVLSDGAKCTAHIFEERIVLMGTKIAEHIRVAYVHFLKIVKPFLMKKPPGYEADKYTYRHTRMMSVHGADSGLPLAPNKSSAKSKEVFERLFANGIPFSGGGGGIVRDADAMLGKSSEKTPLGSKKRKNRNDEKRIEPDAKRRKTAFASSGATSPKSLASPTKGSPLSLMVDVEFDVDEWIAENVNAEHVAKWIGKRDPDLAGDKKKKGSSAAVY
jgi:TATA-box binding protein (TBP) (component of TFIID and TFIIIB)